MSRLPSLRGLQAFEATARSGSLSAAASALGLTPSAVSHRLKGLEDELGTRLFERTPTGLTLTEQGHRYRTDVEYAFNRLRKATDELFSTPPWTPLRVSVTSEIGIRWLMPRFHRFRALHPTIDTAIISTSQPADLFAGVADVALLYGDGHWPGLESDEVLSFSVSPLCAPAAMKGFEADDPGSMLRQCTIIRDTNHEYDDWDAWLAAAGIGNFRPAHELRFADYSMAIAAATDSQGVVLGYTHYVEQEVATGLLVRPFEIVVPVSKGYYLLYEKGRLADTRVRAFRDWVLAESKSSNNLFPSIR